MKILQNLKTFLLIQIGKPKEKSPGFYVPMDIAPGENKIIVVGTPYPRDYFKEHYFKHKYK